jgi:alkylation response protein AidB-like acyl-CoA dehydrogenase
MRRSEAERADDRMLRDSARQFLDAEHGWRADRPAPDWRGFVAQGWPGLALPAAAGGLGADLHQVLEILREAGRALLPDSLAADLLIAPLLAPEAPALAALMPGLLAGERRFALVTGARVSAGRVTLSGALVPGAAAAGDLLVAAKADDGAARLLHLPASAAQRAAVTLIDGRSAARLSLDAPLSEARLLAGGNAAAGLIARARALQRAAQVSEALGAFEAGFAITVDHLATRRQFGQPLAGFQAVQHKMAEVYAVLEALRSLHLRMVAGFAADAATRDEAVAAARLYLDRRALPAVGQLIQVSGGIALTEDYMLGHVYRRLQADAALFGGTAAALDHMAQAAARRAARAAS